MLGDTLPAIKYIFLLHWFSMSKATTIYLIAIPFGWHSPCVRCACTKFVGICRVSVPVCALRSLHSSRHIDCDFNPSKSQLHRVIVTNPFYIHRKCFVKSICLWPAYVGQPAAWQKRTCNHRSSNRQGVLLRRFDCWFVRLGHSVGPAFGICTALEQSSHMYTCTYSRTAMGIQERNERQYIHIIGKSMHAFTTTHMWTEFVNEGKDRKRQTNERHAEWTGETAKMAPTKFVRGSRAKVVSITSTHRRARTIGKSCPCDAEAEKFSGTCLNIMETRLEVWAEWRFCCDPMPCYNMWMCACVCGAKTVSA